MSDVVVPGTWRDRIEAFAGRRREVRVVVLTLAVLVLVGLVVRGRTSPVVAPVAPAPPSTAATAAPADPAIVLVHVAGAVVRPGLYELPGGARVADALDAAGGATRAADLNAVNLADIATDGSQILVPRRGAAAAAPAQGAPPTPAVVDLNSADQAALETIPGVGPVTAAAILQHRAAVGRFTSFEELLDVDGIGPATLESIRPYVAL